LVHGVLGGAGVRSKEEEGITVGEGRKNGVEPPSTDVRGKKKRQWRRPWGLSVKGW